MMGVDPRTMQKWMGHKDLATTLRYAHVSPDHEKAAIERLHYDTWHQDGTSVQGSQKSTCDWSLLASSQVL